MGSPILRASRALAPAFLLIAFATPMAFAQEGEGGEALLLRVDPPRVISGVSDAFVLTATVENTLSRSLAVRVILEDDPSSEHASFQIVPPVYGSVHPVEVEPGHTRAVEFNVVANFHRTPETTAAEATSRLTFQAEGCEIDEDAATYGMASQAGCAPSVVSRAESVEVRPVWVDLSVENPVFHLAPGNTHALRLRVANPDTIMVSTRVAVEPLGQRGVWTLSPARLDEHVDLPPGGTREFMLSVTAPSDAFNRTALSLMMIARVTEADHHGDHGRYDLAMLSGPPPQQGEDDPSALLGRAATDATEKLEPSLRGVPGPAPLLFHLAVAATAWVARRAACVRR